MKRKYLSALLMGTLTVASMSTFTSCKDYDDDISNLQGQIDKLASADELKQKVSELQALISANQSGINSLQSELAKKTTLDEVKAVLANYATNESVTKEANEIVNAAIKALQDKDIAELKTAIEAAQKTADQAVKDAADAKAEILKTLEDYALKSDVEAVRDAANTAIAAVKSENTQAINAAKTEILEKLQDYATKEALNGVAEAAKAAVEAAKADNATKLAEAKTALEAKITAAQNTADEAKTKAAENAAAILALANTTTTANNALAQANANKTAIENALKTLGTGFSEQNTVAAAIEAINGQLTAKNTGLSGLDGRLSAIEVALRGDEDGDKLPNLKLQVDNIENDLKKIIGEYTTMVTGVELVASYSGTDDFGNTFGKDLSYWGNSVSLDMIHGLVAESSVFGDEVSDKIENPVTYEKGQDIKDDNSIIVRINPVNAELTKNTKIVLLNSKGESLEDYVTVGEPTKFTDLIVASRAATVNSGLWKLPVHVAKGVSNEEFKKATQVNGKTILYAVAVKNTETQKDAQDRYVVSTYDVKPTYEDFVAKKDFTFNVNEKPVNQIHNRWTGSAIYGENGNDHSDSNPELAWNSNGPATAPVTSGDNKNVQNASGDEVRYGNSLLQVEVGKKFTISDVKAGDTNAADYYYVVLDKKNAIESGVSELNAWNSYVIDGLKKVVKAGDKLDLTIKSASANGDIIGFRVYAVNRDGKLLDPDGKAFYVVVGDAITGNILGNLDAYKGVTDKKEFKAVAGVDYNGWQIDEEASKDALPFLNNGDVPSFSPVYYKEDGKTITSNLSEVAYIAFNVTNPQYIKDGATVVLKNVAYKSNNGNRYEVGTVRASYTKVLPAAFPSDITFRPKQETTDGSGNFKAYMKPVSDYIVAAAAKTEGTVDLDNIFYNLDTKVSFTVKDAAKVADKIVDVTSDPDHVLTINKEFIDSQTPHAITASYNFGRISCQYNAETNAWETKNWIKTSEKSMNVTFACWESANSYAWNKATAEIKDGDVVIFTKNATQPQLKWTAAGTSVTVGGKYIKTANSYNNDYFGGMLDAVIGTKNFLQVVPRSAHLYYGAQEDPYFKVSVDGYGNATFTQIDVQAENAPVADHVETLKFKVRDAFWHERTISLDVKILRPAAAAKRK